MYPLPSFYFSWWHCKIQNPRRLIPCNIKNRTLTMKKHVDYEHVNVVDMYFIEVSQRCYTSLEHFEKQSFKN